MKKIATLNGDEAKALGSLLDGLGFLSHLQILNGSVSQKIGEDAYIIADLSSLVRQTTLQIVLDKPETKALKAIDPGMDDVDVFAGDESYVFIGGNYEVSLARHEPLTVSDSLPQNITPAGTIINWSCTAASSSKKAYTGVLVKKGPLTFEFDAMNTCTSIVNHFGARFRMNSQTMIPAEQRVVAPQTELNLHSFWLHEFKGASYGIRVHKVASADPAYGQWEYWLDADIAFGSGVAINLIEKLLPQVW